MLATERLSGNRKPTSCAASPHGLFGIAVSSAVLRCTSVILTYIPKQLAAVTEQGRS